MISGTMVQSTGGCPQGCGGGNITGFTCVSRTGSGTLRGWSKTNNENSGDWSARKSKRFDVNISMNPLNCRFIREGCGGNIVELGHSHNDMVQLVALWNVASNAIAQSAQFRNYRTCGAFSLHDISSVPIDDYSSVSCNGDTTLIGTTYPTDWSSLESHNASFNTFINSEPFPDSGCDWTLECELEEDRFIEYYRPDVPAYTVLFTLSDFDSVAAAQARGSPTVGSSCQTLPGTIGSTTAGSDTQISLGAATRSVVSTISCAGLTNGADYEISATLERRNSTTNAFISTDIVTITFTAGGTTDTVDYDVPVETGVKVQFMSADSIVAV